MKPSILNTARLSFPLATAIAALLSAQSARAADGTWLGTSGDWNATGTWSGGIIAEGTGSTANFTGVDITADQTITLTAPQTIGNITFTDATTDSHNLTISGANILTLDAAGTPEINVTQNTRTLTISSAVAGNDGLTKVGPGTLSLNGANTYSGVTTISAGRLNLGNLNALGNTSGITIGGASAATLSASLTNITIGVPITTANTGVSSTIAFVSNNSANFTLNGAIGGNGNVIFSNLGAGNRSLNLGAASNYAGSTTITSDSSITHTVKNTSGAANALPTTTVLSFTPVAGAGTGRFTTYDLNGQNQTLAGLSFATALPNLRDLSVTSASAATLTINNTADFSFGAATVSSSVNRQARITGAIALTKDGAGTFTLGGTLSGGATSNDHDYTGATNILGGTLRISSSGTINSTSGVSIGAGEFNYNSTTALTPGISFSGTSGTLSGTGTVTPAVVITSGNRHTAGTSVTSMNTTTTVGSQTFTNGITYNANSIFEWNLNANNDVGIGTRGTDYDAVNAGALATTGDKAIFRVILNGTDNFDETFWNTDRTWANIFTGLDSSSALNIDSIFKSSVEYYNSAGIVTNANAIRSFTISGTSLVWAVPEPSTTTLVGLFLTAGLLRRRR